MVPELLWGLSMLAFVLFVNNDVKQQEDSLSFAAIFNRHANFDSHALKITLTDQAWYSKSIQLVWVDEQTPYVGFDDQVPLFQVTPQGHCTNTLFMAKTIINDVIAIDANCSMFLARIIINDPSAFCDHFLAVRPIDSMIQHPVFPSVKPHMSRPNAQCENNMVSHQMSTQMLQANLTDLAQTKFAVALQWTLKHFTQKTLHVSAQCVMNNTSDILFNILNNTLSQFKHDSLHLRSTLYLTTENELHVYFEP